MDYFERDEFIILNVPYDDKDEAKKLGAYWHNDIKKWYFKKSNNKEKSKLNYLKFGKWYENKEDSIPFIDLNNINNVSVKIGKNLSKSLLTSLQDAKKRIYICSPYFNAEAIEYIEFLQQRNNEIDIKLLVSSSEKINELSEKQKDNLKYFIGADVKEDILKKENILNEINNLNKNIKNINIFRLFFILIFLGITFFIFYKYRVKNLYWIISTIIIFLSSKFLFDKNIKNIKNLINKHEKTNTLYVEYFQKRKNFKVVENNPFPHVKLYIIDNTAYLGSINFSNTALFFNIESLVEIKDESSVNKLFQYFNELYDYLLSIDNKEFGKMIYNEFELMQRYRNFESLHKF